MDKPIIYEAGTALPKETYADDEFMKVPMNSADKLWEIKKLEHRISYLGTRLERRWAAEKLNRIQEPEFKEESRRISAEHEEVRLKISKLLEDE